MLEDGRDKDDRTAGQGLRKEEAKPVSELFKTLYRPILQHCAVNQSTVDPELMKISYLPSDLSDSKNQTIINTILLANDRDN